MALTHPTTIDGPPARVVWLFVEEDEAIARELLRFSAVLARQGLVENWSVLDVLPGQEWRQEVLNQAYRADVLLLLVSPDLWANKAETSVLLDVVRMARQSDRVRVVPVLVRQAKLPADLAFLQSLPRDGKPIAGRRDRDEALLEVIQGLQEIVTFRPTESDLPLEHRPGREAEALGMRRSAVLEQVVTEPESDGAALSINDIFRLDGPPRVTFVEPPQFPVLKLELRTMGTGLLVEGPSKIGKSTAIKKAMESLGVPEERQIWWFGQVPPPLDTFRRVLDELLLTKQNTWLFIDDFHYLENEEYRRTLAFRMKALADQDERHAKVTLIGINPLGNSLVQAMPDLAGRFRILRIDREKDWAGSTKIAELIFRGELAANVQFRRRDEFVVTAGGSFFIAQLLCNRAAIQAGVFERAPRTVSIELGPSDVVAAISDELAARYRAPMLDFASYDVAPPPRGAGLSLLWLLSRSADGFVALKEAKLRFPKLGPVFDWFLASNLSRCFEQYPSLKGLLYFNRASATLTMEDPQLKFYLRELNWEEFAAASGHGQVRFHPEDGPLWSGVITAALVTEGRGEGSVTPTVVRGEDVAPIDTVSRVLHLSDLHFGTADQATVAYAQLAADLRQQGVERLDALLVSGDVVNRAVSAEYDAARMFLEQLMSGFALAPRRVAIVPGNHDVNWTLSEAAYSLRKRGRHGGELREGEYISHGADVVEVRDEEAYRRRFQPFADFHRQVTGEEYPLEYGEQGIVTDLADLGICVLGLNSAWEIDHHYRDRASIHMGALSRALVRLGPPPDGQLRVAMFHHPIHSGEDSRIRDPAFLQQLAVQGFRLVLHGHVHKADAALYRYDRTAEGRRLEVIAAGTFGAPVREWVSGYPLQYNLLLVGKKRLTVETRCRREVNGAWEADALWRQGPGQDPVPRYHVDLLTPRPWEASRPAAPTRRPVSLSPSSWRRACRGRPRSGGRTPRRRRP